MLYYLHSDYKVPKKSKDESVCDKKLAKKSLLKRNFFSAMTKCESSSKGALIKRRSVTGQQSSNYTSCTSSSSIELKLSTRCLTPFDTYLARYVSAVDAVRNQQGSKSRNQTSKYSKKVSPNWKEIWTSSSWYREVLSQRSTHRFTTIRKKGSCLASREGIRLYRRVIAHMTIIESSWTTTSINWASKIVSKTLKR